MKKRTIWMIGIILAIFIIAGLGIVYFLYTSNGVFGTELQKRGNAIFGKETCTTNHYLESGGDAFTDWTCALCGKEGTNPDTNVPKICSTCARITGRCMQCGNLEK